MVSWPVNLYTIILLISSLAAGLVALLAWRRRGSVGAEALAHLMAAAMIWSIGEACSFGSATLAEKLFWVKFKYLGILPLPVFFFIFSLEYTGQKERLRLRSLLLLFALPLILLLLVWTAEYHRLFFAEIRLETSGGYALFQKTAGVAYWINLIYSYLLTTASMLLLFLKSRSAPQPYRNQILIILAATLVPSLVNFVSQLGLQVIPDLDLTPFFFGVTGAIIAWGLFRFQFLEISPVARELVVESMHDSMLVLDIQNRVIDLNASMETLLGMPRRQVIGQPVAGVFHDQFDPIRQLLGEAILQMELSIEAGDVERRDFELQVSPIQNRDGQIIGRLVILRDIGKRRKAIAELEQYAAQNAHLLAEEQRQRQIAESLRQSLMTISSSLDHDAIVGVILAQLKKVIPYHSAALYLLDGEELKLERLVGEDAVTGAVDASPHQHDQITQIFKLQQAEVFISAYTNNSNGSAGENLPIHSSIAAPLVIGQQALGVLTIDRFEQWPFTQDDAEILQAFANQAAIAIKNAELYQQAQTLAALEERNRLAQDLHDAVNQTLFTASIMAEAVPQVWERDPAQGRRGLEEVRKLTRGALAEMRTLLLELRPQAITEKPLGDLLMHLTRAVSSRTRVPVYMNIANDAILPPEVQVAFYRIAQEAFNNIVKHAEATHVQVHSDTYPGQATLTIQDNGQGFEIDETRPGHLGLEIMRERANKIGADFFISSQPNKGTRIELSWPAQAGES